MTSFAWHQGALSIQSQWDAEKAALNAEAAKQIQEANDRVAAAEREAVRKVAATDAKYQAVLKEKRSEEAIAIARASTGGLRINAKCPGNPNAVSGSASSSSSSDGEARVELSKADGDFLIRFAAEADRLTEQLNACQTLLEEERK
jgi:hypothetical protein